MAGKLQGEGMSQKRNLLKTVTLFVFPFVSLVFLLSLFLSYYYQQIYLKAEFMERGEALTRHMAFNCQKLMEHSNRDSLYEVVDSLMKESDISWAAIIDAGGQVLVQNGATDINFTGGTLVGNSTAGDVQIREIKQASGQWVYDLEAGVINESGHGEKLGSVHVGLSLQALNNMRWKMFWQLFGAFVIGLVFSILAINYFRRSVLNPINELVVVMRDIASRKADLTRRLESRRTDELGEVAMWFNSFMDNIQKIVGSTLGLIDQMSTSLEELSSTAQELSATADEINSTVQTFTHDLQKQEEETSATTTSIDKVATTLLEITHKAEQSSDVFAQTKDVSKRGGETVQQSVQKINAIAQSMDVIEERMRHLNSSLSDIAGFVETIQGIASQTNLLSLNAAIEAARAGDTGRGFSVVAEEVRKLAENAASASQQIQSLINQIQTETRETGEATRLGSQAVQSGRDTIHLAGSSLDEIMKTANQSASISVTISNELNQQSDALKDMMKRVRKVQSLGNSNFTAAQTMAASLEEQTASLEQITTSIQRLAEDALKVKDLVVEFKV
jgi:methyl-accepting chemotaxis protein